MKTPITSSPLDRLPNLWKSYVLLFRTAQALASERLEKFYGEGCGLDLRMVWVLVAIEEESTSQADLCEVLRINTNVMVELIDKMESKRLLKRARNPENRRKYRLELTAKGREAVAWLGKNFEAAQKMAWHPIPLSEIEQIAVLARRFVAAHFAANGK